MRIHFNRLAISTKVDPVSISENFRVTCPWGSATLPSTAFWLNMFRALHRSEEVDSGMAYLFTPEQWKYTGNQILAEAIVESQAPFWDGSSAGDTWMVLLHKPIQ